MPLIEVFRSSAVVLLRNGESERALRDAIAEAENTVAEERRVNAAAAALC